MRNKGMIIFSAGVIGAMLIAAGWSASILPPGQQLPMHWGLSGQPDRFADKWRALFSPVVLAVAMTLLFAFVGRLEPRREALAASQGLIRAVWIGMLVLAATIQLMMISVGARLPLDPIRLLLGALGLMFVLMGNQLGKSRPMYMVGIRTPWTLADEDVWIATHRLGGKLFVAAGLLWLAAALIGARGAYLFIALLTAMLIATLVPIGYSYALWRRRHPAA